MNATAEALGTLRAAAETLTRAGADADALRLESRAQLLDAQSFRDRKSSELAAAEEAVKTESDRLATRVAELRDELARTERKATDAAARAKLAAEERLEFEEAHGAVRDALQSKVSELDRRVREYAAESLAVEAVAVCVGAVAEHRRNALKTLASDAKIDEARARGAYVASVAAHARGQAGRRGCAWTGEFILIFAPSYYQVWAIRMTWFFFVYLQVEVLRRRVERASGEAVRGERARPGRGRGRRPRRGVRRDRTEVPRGGGGHERGARRGRGAAMGS